MATITFLDESKRFIGSRKGLTFDRSQAGELVKRKSSPVNHQTTPRMKLRTFLKACNQYYWNLTLEQKETWGLRACAIGIRGPYSARGVQAGCAGFFFLELNARLAGDPFYPDPPDYFYITGVTFTALERIDKDTLRATFNPSPAGADNRIYLRQALPGPGVRQWSAADGYIAPYSPLNPSSPYDFTTQFQILDDWNCRCWTGTQETTGRRRAAEFIWDLSSAADGQFKKYQRPRWTPPGYCKR